MAMSALPPIADIAEGDGDVRFVPKADIRSTFRRTYDRNTYAVEKRDALDKWAAHLKIGVAQITGANVTALRNRGSAAGKKR
jgi:hypothetical protein